MVVVVEGQRAVHRILARQVVDLCSIEVAVGLQDWGWGAYVGAEEEGSSGAAVVGASVRVGLDALDACRSRAPWLGAT